MLISARKLSPNSALPLKLVSLPTVLFCQKDALPNILHSLLMSPIISIRMQEITDLKKTQIFSLFLMRDTNKIAKLEFLTDEIVLNN